MYTMYTKGDILEVPTGWDIEIMDPDGDVIVTLNYIMRPGQRWSSYVEKELHARADSLLSHLNR